jgi:biotin operon repressor
LPTQLRDRKLGHLQELQPEVIVSANIGCITHLQSGTATPVQALGRGAGRGAGPLLHDAEAPDKILPLAGQLSAALGHHVHAQGSVARAPRDDRLFHIIQLIRGRRLTTAAFLAQRLEVSERTIYRDVADLQHQGVPLEGEAGVGYRLGAGFDLPPMMFTHDEAKAPGRGGAHGPGVAGPGPGQRGRGRRWARSCRCCRPMRAPRPKRWRYLPRPVGLGPPSGTLQALREAAQSRTRCSSSTAT